MVLAYFAYKCRFSGELLTVEHLLYSLVTCLFNKMNHSTHCIHKLLPSSGLEVGKQKYRYHPFPSLPTFPSPFPLPALPFSSPPLPSLLLPCPPLLLEVGPLKSS